MVWQIVINNTNKDTKIFFKHLKSILKHAFGCDDDEFCDVDIKFDMPHRIRIISENFNNHNSASKYIELLNNYIEANEESYDTWQDYNINIQNVIVCLNKYKIDDINLDG